MTNGMSVVSWPPLPRQIIDLSPTVTEDLPVRVAGKRFLKDFGFPETTEFRVIRQEGALYISNAYWTLMNHGGPHVDAPAHMQRDGAGVDAYDLNALVGPIKVIDARGRPFEEPISPDEIGAAGVRADDVAVVVTGYQPPEGDRIPSFRVLSKESAELLAAIPVRAFATDAVSVDSLLEFYRRLGLGIGTVYEETVHHSFLSRGIPIIEMLVNVEELVGVQNAVLVAMPLKVPGADASPVRAVAFVY